MAKKAPDKQAEFVTKLEALIGWSLSDGLSGEVIRKALKAARKKLKIEPSSPS